MRRPASRGQLQRRGQQCCLGCSGERLGASVASREPQHMECSARTARLLEGACRGPTLSVLLASKQQSLQ